MVFHDAAADGQPEAGSLARAGTVAIHLVELLEHPLQLVGGNAASVVGNAEPQAVLLDF